MVVFFSDSFAIHHHSSLPTSSDHAVPRPHAVGKSSRRLNILLSSQVINSSAGCIPSPLVYGHCGLFRYLVPENQKGALLRQHHSSFQTSAANQLLNTPMRLWRPAQVKSGEMEGNSICEGALADEQALQQNLEQAVKEENYTLAAKLRDDLRLLHEDSRASVLAANARFYNAFKNGDFVAMRSIWAKGDNVCCVHPGAGAISGYDLVIGSWEVICGADHEFPITIDLRNVEVHVRGDVGYVTCLELVKTKGSSWGRQVATNVFERIDGKWLMCIHHASYQDM